MRLKARPAAIASRICFGVRVPIRPQFPRQTIRLTDNHGGHDVKIVRRAVYASGRGCHGSPIAYAMPKRSRVAASVLSVWANGFIRKHVTVCLAEQLSVRESSSRTEAKSHAHPHLDTVRASPLPQTAGTTSDHSNARAIFSSGDIRRWMSRKTSHASGLVSAGRIFLHHRRRRRRLVRIACIASGI